MREVLEKFDLGNTISKLDEAGLLFQVVQRFGDPMVDLHPDAVDNGGSRAIVHTPRRIQAVRDLPREHAGRDARERPVVREHEHGASAEPQVERVEEGRRRRTCTS